AYRGFLESSLNSDSHQPEKVGLLTIRSRRARSAKWNKKCTVKSAPRISPHENDSMIGHVSQTQEVSGTDRSSHIYTLDPAEHLFHIAGPGGRFAAIPPVSVTALAVRTQRIRTLYPRHVLSIRALDRLAH